MSELDKHGYRADYESIVRQYPPGDPAINLDSRWEVYDHVDHPIDPIKVMYALARLLGANKEGTILDAGCNDGSDLTKIYRLGHTGLMYGVDPALDPDSPLLSSYRVSADANGPGIVPSRAKIEDADMAPESIDLLIAKFMLYHVDDVDETLLKFKTWLKPDGILAIATSGEENKSEQRNLEKLIADSLGIDPPIRMNERFTCEIAEIVLPELFDDILIYPRIDLARFDEDNIATLIGSLRSMIDSFDPPIEDEELFWEVINDVVEPVIRQTMEASGGEFVVFTDRRFYLCKKTGLLDMLYKSL